MRCWNRGLAPAGGQTCPRAAPGPRPAQPPTPPPRAAPTPTTPPPPHPAPPLVPSGGVLAVSRSFGNRMLKKFIIPHPEICDLLLSERERPRAWLLHAVGEAPALPRGRCPCRRFDSWLPCTKACHAHAVMALRPRAGHACLVLASDGLWDAVSNQEAVKLALEHRAAGGCAPEVWCMARPLRALPVPSQGCPAAREVMRTPFAARGCRARGGGAGAGVRGVCARLVRQHLLRRRVLRFLQLRPQDCCLPVLPPSVLPLPGLPVATPPPATSLAPPRWPLGTLLPS